jgi:hypothetical protein
MSAGAAAPETPGAPPRLTPQALSQEHDSWLHFVTRSGEAGERWAAEFRRPEHARVVSTAVAALGLFHRRQFDAGRALLEEAAAALAATRGAEASIVLALESIYYPLRAYYDYCVEAYSEAVENLDRADRSVAAAIARERFLLPIAYRCSEFRLHRARIARNQRRWREMHRHIELAWEMMEGRYPLCELADGGGVGVPELVAFFRSLPALDPAVEEYLRGFLDETLRRDLFERFVNRIYALPGFVILYP